MTRKTSPHGWSGDRDLAARPRAAEVADRVDAGGAEVLLAARHDRRTPRRPSVVPSRGRGARPPRRRAAARRRTTDRRHRSRARRTALRTACASARTTAMSVRSSVDLPDCGPPTICIWPAAPEKSRYSGVAPLLVRLVDHAQRYDEPSRALVAGLREPAALHGRRGRAADSSSDGGLSSGGSHTWWASGPRPRAGARSRRARCRPARRPSLVRASGTAGWRPADVLHRHRRPP